MANNEQTHNWTRYKDLSAHDLRDLGMKQLTSMGYIEPEVYWEMDERKHNGDTAAQHYIDEFNSGYRAINNGQDNPSWDNAGSTGTPSPSSTPTSGATPTGGQESLRLASGGTPFSAHPLAGSTGREGAMGSLFNPTPTVGPMTGGQPTAGIPDTGGNQYYPVVGSPAQPSADPIDNATMTPDAPTAQESGGLGGGIHTPYAGPYGAGGQSQFNDSLNTMLYGPDAFLTQENIGQAGVAPGGFFDPNDPSGMQHLASQYYGKDAPGWLSARDQPFLSSENTLSLYDQPGYDSLTQGDLANLVPGRIDNLNSNQYLNAGHYYDQVVTGDYASNNGIAAPDDQWTAVKAGIEALSPYYDPASLQRTAAKVDNAYNEWRSGIETDPQFRDQFPMLVDYLRFVGADEWM